MTKRKIQNLLNEALSVCEIGHVSFDERCSRRSFGVGVTALNIFGDENNFKFDLAANKLLEICFSTTLSKNKFMNIIVGLLRERKSNSSSFSEADADEFSEYCKSLPINEYKVLRELYGCNIGVAESPIRFGCFTIYDWSSHKSLLIPEDCTNKEDFWGGSVHGLLIECVVSARDNSRALEIADVLFARLELVLWFMIGHRSSQYEIGVFNYSGSRLVQHYVIDAHGYTVGNSWQGSFRSFSLDEAYVSTLSEENFRLVSLIEKQETNLDSRLLRSIEWTGQALIDRSPASAFIKATTALEVLFSQNEKGIVTPSIMAQISENCAHLIGKTAEQCLKVERDIKRLYSIRSSVVHSGKNEVHLNDLDEIINIARNVILTILSDEQYYSKHSVEALHDMLKIRRYQYCRQV